MKKLSVVILSALLFACNTSNKVSLNEYIKDIELLTYKINQDKLPEEYKSDKYDYCMLSILTNLNKDKLNIKSDLKVNIKGIDKYIKRIKKLENNNKITKDIINDKVEINDEDHTKINYFIYRYYKNDEPIYEIFDINKLSVNYNYNGETYNTKIGVSANL